MISGTKFVWLHLPKTGGTSTARLFQSLNLEGVIVDDETQDAKHQSLEDRLRCGQDGTETDTNKKEELGPSIMPISLIAKLLKLPE